MRNWVHLIASMLVALALAIFATTPPSPTSPSNDPAEASAERTFEQVERIASEPHPTGSPANDRVRAYLIAQLESMGLEVKTTSGSLGPDALKKLAHWRGEQTAAPTEFVNVIGVMKGADPNLPAIGLMAHYDSVWGSPGAADDAAGVASILETVRALAAEGSPRRDVVVILTDAEELGLEGAWHFFKTDPLAERIGALINLEARGGGGIASMFQTGPGNREGVELYANTVDRPAASSLAAFLYSVLPNDTDLTAALERGGYTAYNIAFIGRSGLYHSPLATPGNLDRGALNHMLAQTHSLARALVNAEQLPQPTTDAVFFDAFGIVTLVYAPWLGWVVLVLAALGYASGYRATKAKDGSVLWGAGRTILLLLGGGVLLYGLNLLSGAGVGAGYYDRLAAIPKLTGMAALAVLSAAVLIWGGKKHGPKARLGAAVPLLLIALAGQWIAPTAAYFIVIPLMLAGLVEAVIARAGDPLGRSAAGVVTALVVGYLLALGWQIMQGVGPSMPFAVVLPAALAVVALLPLWPAQKRPRLVAGVLLAAAIGLALWVRFDPVPPTVAVYSSLKPS
ncbi:M20/M25/M40 family metallo-hydrolase [Erythrobacter mangrovi]|uniref:Vacuolar membrane protease n=1 Tax=Erythrobacter mangrovi TaxID=2739433 RepID=A0A7D4ATZ2_9SPHN|nr:M20/M25/M40 family metallo-hydrolase [Erythrobacter mangrovi]QKG71497.1 M20/M25/M40 family metallo-hydrolase [Erythrobacter mangrovi]